MSERNLRWVDIYLENAIERMKKPMAIKDEIDVLYFLRNICRELQKHTKQDKKQSKAFSDRAKIFQHLMTMKRKQAKKLKQ